MPHPKTAYAFVGVISAKNFTTSEYGIVFPLFFQWHFYKEFYLLKAMLFRLQKIPKLFTKFVRQTNSVAEDYVYNANFVPSTFTSSFSPPHSGTDNVHFSKPFPLAFSPSKSLEIKKNFFEICAAWISGKRISCQFSCTDMLPNQYLLNKSHRTLGLPQMTP